MDIKTILFGVIFLFLIGSIFYFITILLQKIMVKLRENRRNRHNNIDDYTRNYGPHTINHSGPKSSKAILEAKNKMRGK